MHLFVYKLGHNILLQNTVANSKIFLIVCHFVDKINTFLPFQQFYFLRSVRNSKIRDREHRLSSNSVSCQCVTADDNGQCTSNNCGYNSQDEYEDVSKQHNDVDWAEVIMIIICSIV